MKTPLALITATLIAGILTPSDAMPDPDRLGYAPERSTSSFPFDAGSPPRHHLAGNDWLPAGRWG